MWNRIIQEGIFNKRIWLHYKWMIQEDIWVEWTEPRTVLVCIMWCYMFFTLLLRHYIPPCAIPCLSLVHMPRLIFIFGFIFWNTSPITLFIRHLILLLVLSLRYVIYHVSEKGGLCISKINHEDIPKWCIKKSDGYAHHSALAVDFSLNWIQGKSFFKNKRLPVMEEFSFFFYWRKSFSIKSRLSRKESLAPTQCIPLD